MNPCKEEKNQMSPQGDGYEAICDPFEWDAPEFYNIGQDVCDKWADTEPHRLALIFLDDEGLARKYSLQAIKPLYNRTFNLLSPWASRVKTALGFCSPAPGNRFGP